MIILRIFLIAVVAVVFTTIFLIIWTLAKILIEYNNYYRGKNKRKGVSKL